MTIWLTHVIIPLHREPRCQRAHPKATSEKEDSAPYSNPMTLSPPAKPSIPQIRDVGSPNLRLQGFQNLK